VSCDKAAREGVEPFVADSSGTLRGCVQGDMWTQLLGLRKECGGECHVVVACDKVRLANKLRARGGHAAATKAHIRANVEVTGKGASRITVISPGEE
jgi:hypothetical protein